MRSAWVCFAVFWSACAAVDGTHARAGRGDAGLETVPYLEDAGDDLGTPADDLRSRATLDFAGAADAGRPPDDLGTIDQSPADALTDPIAPFIGQTLSATTNCTVVDHSPAIYGSGCVVNDDSFPSSSTLKLTFSGSPGAHVVQIASDPNDWAGFAPTSISESSTSNSYQATETMGNYVVGMVGPFSLNVFPTGALHIVVSFSGSGYTQVTNYCGTESVSVSCSWTF